MNGKKRGVMILKNGGDRGNAGGNLISKMIEFNFLHHQHTGYLHVYSLEKGHPLLLQIFRDRKRLIK